ncbi:MAG: hypothetical protein AAB656_00920 [Patescibacteria group bacterium]
MIKSIISFLLSIFSIFSLPQPALVPGINNTQFPLKIADGFTISIFAKGLGSPRDLEFDPSGTLLVSIPEQGKVVALPNGRPTTVAGDLNQPHGITFSGNKIYVSIGSSCNVYV